MDQFGGIDIPTQYRSGYKLDVLYIASTLYAVISLKIGHNIIDTHAHYQYSAIQFV